jgi:hypothetical protein
MLLDQVGAMAEEFDIIHFHTDYLHFPLAKRLPVPHVTTLGRLDFPELVPLYRHFCDVPLISISNSQRSPLPWVAWQGTVTTLIARRFNSAIPNCPSLSRRQKSEDYGPGRVASTCVCNAIPIM